LVDDICRNAGIAPRQLGRGSTEPIELFIDLATKFSVPIGDSRSKPEIAKSIVEHSGGEWSDECDSRGSASGGGSTVTGEGLRRVLNAVVALRRTEDFISDDTRIGEASNRSDEADEREALEASVAEYLAVLSDSSESPTEFDPPSYSFESREVDFSDPSDWSAKVEEVQGWLRLPGTLASAEIGGFLSELARGLGLLEGDRRTDNPPDSELLEALRARAERATQLREMFLEAIESEDGNRDSATAQWIEGWDEDLDEPEAPGSVSARATTWSIADFSTRAEQGELELSPSFQRSDVWPTGDAQLLIESILRGIPLPSVIILKPSESGSSKYQLVDGKQRLTAILRFVGKHPEALRRVNEADEQYPDAGFLELFRTNYRRFRRVWRSTFGEPLSAAKEREYYFPFMLRTGRTTLSGDLKQLEGKYYSEIRDIVIPIADSRVKVNVIFELSGDYKIPIIEYSKATQKQIHDVFKLYNKQGKHLNAEEIRNAVFHDRKLARALLVAAGDYPEVDSVAPFLETAWEDLRFLPDQLKDYGFGTARFRRTKILSWIASVLLVDTLENGSLRTLSTARQIDALFDEVSRNQTCRLNSDAVIVDLLRLIQVAVSAHSAIDEAWTPRFKDTKNGSKWQELQLVASVVGISIAAAVLGDGVEDRLDAVSDQVRLLTSDPGRQRPKKTQTKDQWLFISEIACSVAELLGVSIDDADTAVLDRFGMSGIRSVYARFAGGQSVV
jgi:hypothetical protein